MRLQDERVPAPTSTSIRSWRRWIVGIVAVVVAVAIIDRLVVANIGEPLRRSLERRVNESLTGYTVTIGALDLHIVGFAVELKNVTVVQDARPSPPVLYLPSWRTRLDWRALLSLALVADTTFERPRAFITIEQTSQEARDPVPVTEHGWQDAVQAVYPLKINTLRVIDGDVSYYDVGNVPPLELEHLYFRASNIRNVRSVAGQFPSPIELSSSVLEGTLTANGHADFLAKPNPTLNTEFELRDANLVPIAPMVRRFDLTVTQGTVGVAGRIVLQEKETAVDLSRVEVSKPSIEYARDPRPSERPVERAVVAAKEAVKEPGVRVDVQDIRIRDGTLALKVDALRSEDGKTVYVDSKDLPPLRLDDLNVHATSISSEPRPRSSPTRFEVACRILDDGRLDVSGTIDPHAEPRPTLVADFDLRDLPLAPFAPLARHWAFELSQGTLAGKGRLDIRPDQEALVLHRVVVANPSVAYVQRTATDERRLERVTRAATDAQPKPTFRLDVEDARLRSGTFTFDDASADPPYRLALTHSDVDVHGFSNQESKRRGRATLRGRFMESGTASIDATFASGTQSPDLDMRVRLEDAKLVELNDLLRARGGFDVVNGLFSFYAEMAARDGRVTGYVKPFFKDLDVYDRKQDSKKPVGRQAYEALVGVAGTVLENRLHDQIATRADLSGPVEHPDAPTWQIVVGLLKNAFWSALLPGLDHARQQR
jgi:hypothetical protein